MTAGGADEQSSIPNSSEKIDPMKEMRLTIGRSILPEGGDPQVLHGILKRGQMVIFDETPEEIPWLISSGILINTPPELIWSVVSDFEKFPEWVPSCHSIDTVKRGDNIYDITYSLGFKFILLPLHVKYTIRRYDRPPLRLDYIGLGGTIEKTYGWNQNIPVEDGNTMFFYTTWALPGSGLLKHLYRNYPFLDVGISVSAGLVYSKKVKERAELLKGEVKIEGLMEETHGGPAISKAEELKTMELLSSRGPVQIFKKPEEGKPSAVSTWIIFALPPEKVWADLVDYENYYYFMPMMKGIKVLEREDNKARVEYKYDINIVFFSSKIKYQLEYHYHKPGRITWINIKGNRYVLSGSWELFPLDDGKKTLASYRVYYDARSLGFLPRLILKAIPEGELAVNSYLSSIRVREMRDWIEAPTELRSELKELRERERNLRWQEWKRKRKEQISRQGKGK
jgi:carbon monoxide dehydrogenase subunit G